MILIQNAYVVNEGMISKKNILIKGEYIYKISDSEISVDTHNVDIKKINAEGLYLLPGCIDDQVHFREPGLTHKGDIYHESKACIAGGITSFMEMPNTIPQTTTIRLLEEKYAIAHEKSLANYSFYLGATNTNIEEVLRLDPQKICGVKAFLGSSTGNMLLDNPVALRNLFSQCKMLIAVHCESNPIIEKNLQLYKKEYGNDIPIHLHPKIRSEEACFASSSMAIQLAKECHTRLHVIHLSTQKELSLFDAMPVQEKHITSEVCVHHLYFCDQDYHKKGTLIKWNPAIKTEEDQKSLLQALINNKIDVIASDHAPHLLSEKNNTYLKAPSGGPLVQHALLMMLDLYKQNKITIEKIVEKMSHSVAQLFRIQKRGFIREGYYADLVMVDINRSYKITQENILYKCGWSPLEGHTLGAYIVSTIVNGHLTYDQGVFDETHKGQRLLFQ